MCMLIIDLIIRASVDRIAAGSHRQMLHYLSEAPAGAGRSPLRKHERAKRAKVLQPELAFSWGFAAAVRASRVRYNVGALVFIN
jgi:hypothetical protein